MRLFHYGIVEPIYLSKLLGNEAEDLLSISTDLLAVVREHYFSGIGYGLKKLAPLAGFSWRDDNMTGEDTYVLIDRARNGNWEAWEMLLRYNEDDTRATKSLRDWLRAIEPPLNRSACRPVSGDGA